MRAVLQRVSRGEVRVDSQITGKIGLGLVVFLGVGRDDTDQEVDLLLDKIVGLRIFADEAGKMNLSVEDVGGALLVVSQFTLYGDCRKGRRPSFIAAGPPDIASRLYDRFVSRARQRGLEVGTGVFQALMEVDLVNDGPVTIWLDTDDWK